MTTQNSSQHLRKYFPDTEENDIITDTEFDDSYKELTYWELEQYLLINKETKAVETLSKLYIIVKELVTNLQEDIANDVCINFVSKFICETSFLNKHHHELKEQFGNITYDVAKKIFLIVQEFKEVVSEECINIITSNNCVTNDVASHSTIPFLYETNPKVREKIHNMRSTNPNNVDVVKNFSMLYNENGTTSCNKLDSGLDDTPIINENSEKWLIDFMKKYNITQYSNEEFCYQVLDIILFPQKDLKTDLFQFLHFEHYEFLEFLKKNMYEILKHGNPALLQEKNLVNRKKPAYGLQVTVQSKYERELSKQLRKIEKKKQKKDLDNNIVKYSKIKSEHESASVEPILKRKALNNIILPNVYDNAVGKQYARVPTHGNYVPSVAESSRKDEGAWEIITVDAPDKNAAARLDSYVQIEDLDDIGQLVFQGVKSLNTIQSIVFPIAYATNENMLVCAPTGAGKTNIALLTITHQIKQYIVSGMIDRSKFKIVYVAPMKALAAEITEKFSAKLKVLGVKVRELTGDMQLTKLEIRETQLIVTTPEKWDVISRKGATENEIINVLRLLIIDEVHLLHGMRGPVIEALVARTLRQVEASQSMIRIIGLSATLPNYVDVARFLNVNCNVGLFYFDARFRPVPLTQKFIGIKPMRSFQVLAEMDNACYSQVTEILSGGHQVMVFVHARNMTVHTANALKEKAIKMNQLHYFQQAEGGQSIQYKNAMRSLSKSPNKILLDLASNGFGVHHAGLLRSDRDIMEKCFHDGVIKVLVCTSTLAWGVNLPAHGVIIKGTDIYDSRRGTNVDLDILDVLQIFGRAGRPQYDTSGVAVIITTHDKVNRYLKLLTHQIPIESSFLERLPDHLNAEIALGTVSSVKHAIEWLSYTYLHQRLCVNPQVYGINYSDVQQDPSVHEYREKIICEAAEKLDRARMIRFSASNGDFICTDLGRTASHFYISYDTVQLFNNCLQPFMTEKDILVMIAQAEEFHQLKVRNDECDELEFLMNEYCHLAVPDGGMSVTGKVNILMQTYLSRGRIKNFALISDMAYISQNVVRITKALFEIALHQSNPTLAGRCLMLSQMFELQQWDFQTPFRQFSVINLDLIEKIENRGVKIDLYRDEDSKYLTSLFKSIYHASLAIKCAMEFPFFTCKCIIQPITRSVLRIRMSLHPEFNWNERVHGRSESFWMWIEDPDNNTIYYYENFLVSKRDVNNVIELVFTVPLVEPQPSQYLARISSEKWLGCSYTFPISFQHLILPVSYPPHTDLLVIQPLPVSTLYNKAYIGLYKFSHFNPIQSQVFHCMHLTDHNSLVGAPTGSGKTVIAELAMLRLFVKYPCQKVVYIAPLKALVRERVVDWSKRFGDRLGKYVIELTGDVSPNIRNIKRANVIITTPEKWDGLSRSWQSRNYVTQVGLMIIDEIHLLGEDRGPVLEVIVSRTKLIAANTNIKLRIIGLSTAMANARDLASWLEVPRHCLFNFRPSVRPVPLEVHISGYPGKHYCPRMVSMNRPTYQAIRLHAPHSPALVFVSSRRQTKITAVDLIAFLATDTDSKQWLHMSEDSMTQIIRNVKDTNLKLCLPFGIGIHHAGLEERDRRVTEELFVNQKIQVLIATSTLAWGVNFPAHLVVVKGTEYFDGKLGKYVDMPITDVLQMMGRAGRPQFDNSGVAVVLVHDIKKNFYKKFLYEPFPVESSLLSVLPDHINAEIVAGTIQSINEFLEYLTWTFFYRRIYQNPTYYNLRDTDTANISIFLNFIAKSTFKKLTESKCIEFDWERNKYIATPSGQIASFYYLSHETVKYFNDNIKHNSSIVDLLQILSSAREYAEFPVRHNEDIVNKDLADMFRFKCENYNSPHTKVFLLLQAYFSRITMPMTDYVTDLKTVLEQALRILQAMIDIAAKNSWLSCIIRLQQLSQMIVQGQWLDDSPLLQLHDFDRKALQILSKKFRCDILANLRATHFKDQIAFRDIITAASSRQVALSVMTFLNTLPMINVKFSIKDTVDGWKESLYNGEQTMQAHVLAEHHYKIYAKVTRRSINTHMLVSTRRFPKTKEEMWFLNLGYKMGDKLVSVQRVNCQDTATYKIAFIAPEMPGKYTLTVFIMSDSYIGLDQQYDIILRVS